MATEHTKPETETESWEFVFDELYQSLRAIAGFHLASERTNHTLQPTALVNEVFLRFQRNHPTQIVDESHFLRLASRVVRQVLVDYARYHTATKRGHRSSTPYNESLSPTIQPPSKILELDEALTELAKQLPRASSVVEMRYFGGLSNTEIANAINVSVRTVDLDWVRAKAFLAKHLHPDMQASTQANAGASA